MGRRKIDSNTNSADAWELLNKQQSRWVARLKKTNSHESFEIALDDEEDTSSNIVGYIFESLSPCPERHFSSDKDLAVIKKAVSAIIEARDEDILTQTEAGAILEFITQKFVERRFGTIMERVFNAGTPRRYSFRTLRGSIK